MLLKTNPEPSVTAGLMRAAVRSDGFREREKTTFFAALRAEPSQQQTILPVQLRGEPPAAYVLIGGSVDFIADRGVVCRDRLGDGRRRSADAKEPTDDFLPRADLRERAEHAAVEVDLKRLFVSGRPFPFHRFQRNIGGPVSRPACAFGRREQAWLPMLLALQRVRRIQPHDPPA